jgi:hypothetical protein
LSENLNAIRASRAVLLLGILTLSGCLSGESSIVSGTSAGSRATGNDPSNSAPVISGSPNAAVLVGDTYSFVPAASDSDGDVLTFSITNKPGWATFNTSNGRLSGQALLGNVGDYGAIRISVSDGDRSASLPDFSITVAQTALGSISLSWSPPTQNTDGSSLTDLAGYKLYYGQSSGTYDKSIRIDNPSISTYVIDNLVPDTYYIVATAFNSAGVESGFSGEAVKTVTSD